MKVTDLLKEDKQEHWLEKLDGCDWRAGRHLAQYIRKGTLTGKVGEDPKVLLLTDGNELVSFCTLSKVDDIQPVDLTPWMGFVYTYPEYRGHRYISMLIKEIERIAGKEGFDAFYVCTDHEGLYEKYGFRYLTEMNDTKGNPSRVYVKNVDDMTKEKKKTVDFIADGVLSYGTEVGRIIFEENRTVIYALSDLTHIAASDSTMLYQISKEDYDRLLALSRPDSIPDPPVSSQVSDGCRRTFLCGESVHCKRNGFTLEDVDLSLTEYC